MNTTLDIAAMRELREKMRLDESPSQRNKRVERNMKRLQQINFQVVDSKIMFSFSIADLL